MNIGKFLIEIRGKTHRQAVVISDRVNLFNKIADNMVAPRVIENFLALRTADSTIIFHRFSYIRVTLKSCFSGRASLASRCARCKEDMQIKMMFVFNNSMTINTISSIFGKNRVTISANLYMYFNVFLLNRN